MRYDFNIQPETFAFQAEVDEATSLGELAEFRAPPPPGAAAVANRRHPGYVAWVQSSLNLIRGPRLKVDGVIGPQTRSIVRAFQQQRGQTPDGIVGLRTEAALRSAGAPPLPWERRGATPESEVSQWQSELSRRPGCAGLSGVKHHIGYVEIWLDNCMVGALLGGMGVTGAIAGICAAIKLVPCVVVAGTLTASQGIIVAVNNWGGSRGVKIFYATAPLLPLVPFAIYPQ